MQIFLRISPYDSSLLYGKIFGDLSPASRLYDEWLEKTDTLHLGCMVDCVGFCYTICNLHESQLGRISTRLIEKVLLHWFYSRVSQEITETYDYLGSGNYSANSAICGMLLPYMPNFPLYELSSIIFFLIPMLVILVVYTRMGARIRNSTNDAMNSVVQSAIHGDSRQIQSRKSVIRMLSRIYFLSSTFHVVPLLLREM